MILSGKNGSTNLKVENFTLEFKQKDLRQDIVYITRKNCEGHIVLNWNIYQHNIYLTNYSPPTGSMTIPNLPKD